MTRKDEKGRFVIDATVSIMVKSLDELKVYVGFGVCRDSLELILDGVARPGGGTFFSIASQSLTKSVFGVRSTDPCKCA